MCTHITPFSGNSCGKPLIIKVHAMCTCTVRTLCTQHAWLRIMYQPQLHLKSCMHSLSHSSLNHTANITVAIIYPHLAPGCGLPPLPLH